MKNVGINKRRIAICLFFLMCINSFGAVVSDNDGSAFITKAEFDSLKNNFQSQIDQYNQSIDSKIDGAIAAYLAGIKLTSSLILNSTLDENGNYGGVKLWWYGKNDKAYDNNTTKYVHQSLRIFYRGANGYRSFGYNNYASSMGSDPNNYIYKTFKKLRLVPAGGSLEEIFYRRIKAYYMIKQYYAEAQPFVSIDSATTPGPWVTNIQQTVIGDKAINLQRQSYQAVLTHRIDDTKAKYDGSERTVMQEQYDQFIWIDGSMVEDENIPNNEIILYPVSSIHEYGYDDQNTDDMDWGTSNQQLKASYCHANVGWYQSTSTDEYLTPDWRQSDKLPAVYDIAGDPLVTIRRYVTSPWMAVDFGETRNVNDYDLYMINNKNRKSQNGIVIIDNISSDGRLKLTFTLDYSGDLYLYSGTSRLDYSQWTAGSGYNIAKYTGDASTEKNLEIDVKKDDTLWLLYVPNSTSNRQVKVKNITLETSN